MTLTATLGPILDPARTTSNFRYAYVSYRTFLRPTRLLASWV